MKLSAKIYLGYGSLLGIAILLGGLAVWNMSSVTTEATTLSDEYVPEVAVMSSVERRANQTMYQMRGYAYTLQEDYLKSGQEELARVNEALGEAEKLAASATHLVALQDGVKTLKDLTAEYQRLSERTITDNNQILAARVAQNEAAEIFVKESTAFLENQNQAMTREIQAGEKAEALNERLGKITMINEIIDYGNSARVGAWRAQALREVQALGAVKQLFPKIDRALTEIRKTTRNDIDIRELDAIQRAASAYLEALTSIEKLSIEVEELGKNRTQVGNNVLAKAAEISQAGIDHTNVVAANAVASLGLASTIMVIGLALAVIIGSLLAWTITRSITRPINIIIEGLTLGADQVAAASGQISGSSQQLAEGATEQASSLEETSASLEEMSSMTRKNAENANTANTQMVESKHQVDEGAVAVTNMASAMGEISQASEEISKIIKTIEEIAFQTNLLALNAAVEAARAGDAGKGFAVVAEEVRNLAQRSAQAARDTAQLIESTVERTRRGTEIVGSVESSFRAIEESSARVAELITEITAASQQQAQGVEQVNEAVSQMDKVTQSNAANAEESASASEELSAQAEQLRAIVGDLVTLVGGSTGPAATVRSPQPQKKPRQALHAGTNAHSARDGSGLSDF